VATRTIVVAAGPLRFGAQIAPDSLREVAWPHDAITGRHYSSIDELTAGGKLSCSPRSSATSRSCGRINRARQKATLSAVIQDGMRAVTVRTMTSRASRACAAGDQSTCFLTRQQSAPPA